MNVRRAFLLALAIALCAGVRHATPLRAAQTAPAPSPATQSQSSKLQPESQLLIVRYIDGEYAKALHPLPGGKKGLIVSVDKPLDEQHLQDSLRLYGTIANPGDTIQITNVEFRSKQIVLTINGGPKKHFHWREHVSVGVGNLPDPAPVSHPGEGIGGYLILDYGRPIPNLSADDLKHQLSTILDFSTHSAATDWVESLPPEFKQAIQDHKAVVGMDEDMVVAALGRPDRKVRERDANGNETEDWIYGNPPARTVFVTFSAGKVIRVEEFG